MAGTSIAEPSACPDQPEGRAIRELLDRVGDKWSLLVIGSLQCGPLRFGAIQQEVDGISQRMLTLTLRRLERDGLATRTAYAEVPPRVEYELTDLGRTLMAPVLALAEWAKRSYPQIDANRARFDARA
ncbi:helix-turn-helix domain-containing protein [Kitasatospora sp. MAP5-34]|uniref:winged helix-turn-helix transcriptional regulator n=1 Tax=Kitasatospora sp. MAP5-34 TaxID=3035102 RepID=UPI002473ACB2|nr:helix-turn-helix domain-containing protein [Kitasatospora sp. MAP5-34]MDH6577953.1 DNA-binding HxlR family transcriptional regulator [Kitasatospora sp. MAP5-34]